MNEYDKYLWGTCEEVYSPIAFPGIYFDESRCPTNQDLKVFKIYFVEIVLKYYN